MTSFECKIQTDESGKKKLSCPANPEFQKLYTKIDEKINKIEEKIESLDESDPKKAELSKLIPSWRELKKKIDEKLKTETKSEEFLERLYDKLSEFAQKNEEQIKEFELVEGNKRNDATEEDNKKMLRIVNDDELTNLEAGYAEVLSNVTRVKDLLENIQTLENFQEKWKFEISPNLYISENEEGLEAFYIHFNTISPELDFNIIFDIYNPEDIKLEGEYYTQPINLDNFNTDFLSYFERDLSMEKGKVLIDKRVQQIGMALDNLREKYPNLSCQKGSFKEIEEGEDVSKYVMYNVNVEFNQQKYVIYISQDLASDKLSIIFSSAEAGDMFDVTFSNNLDDNLEEQLDQALSNIEKLQDVREVFKKKGKLLGYFLESDFSDPKEDFWLLKDKEGQVRYKFSYQKKKVGAIKCWSESIQENILTEEKVDLGFKERMANIVKEMPGKIKEEKEKASSMILQNAKEYIESIGLSHRLEAVQVGKSDVDIRLKANEKALSGLVVASLFIPPKAKDKAQVQFLEFFGNKGFTESREMSLVELKKVLINKINALPSIDNVVRMLESLQISSKFDVSKNLSVNSDSVINISHQNSRLEIYVNPNKITPISIKVFEAGVLQKELNFNQNGESLKEEVEVFLGNCEEKYNIQEISKESDFPKNRIASIRSWFMKEHPVFKEFEFSDVVEKEDSYYFTFIDKDDVKIGIFMDKKIQKEFGLVNLIKEVWREIQFLLEMNQNYWIKWRSF